MNTKLLKKAKKRVFISSDKGPIPNPHTYHFFKRWASMPTRYLVFVGDKHWNKVKLVGVANTKQPYKLFHPAWNRRCNEIVKVAKMLNSSWYNYYFK